METEVSVKVIAEVKRDNNSFKITCFSDINADGTMNPSIFKSQIPQERLTVDNVNVKEGELALSYKGGEGGTLNEGVLTIQPADEDDANKYRVENENLVYDE